MTPTPTLLVVDDEAPVRRALDRGLSRAGWRVITAGSAEAAYELLASEPVDALLLDIYLPTMSGLALYLAIVHRSPALAGRIAIMTGDAEAEDVRAWLDRHHCRVIRKPVDLEAFSAWLEDVRRAAPGREQGAAGA